MATPIPPNDASITLDDAAVATGGAILRHGRDSERRAKGIVIDSRAVKPGSVFVALRGETHDGHAFLDAACRLGASYVIIERGRAPADDSVGVLEVADTLVALGALARLHLEAWRASAAGKRVIAITGSAGKTTTKELTAALLSAVAATHFTAGNLNNRVGVPFVVLGLHDDDRFAVLEMGMSLPGELDAITSFARPDVSVVTNVGVAHAEGVGGPDGVMHEKAAVYRALEESGIAVVNADDERATRASQGTRARRRVTFGTKSGADYRVTAREPRGAGGSLVVLATPARELRVTLPLPGEAAAIDLAAALAAQETASGTLLAVETIDAALATVELAGRASLKRLGEDVVVLDDTYNANPASMRSAFSTLVEIAGTRRRVAILGEMKELGVHAEAEHDALGQALADAGVALAIGCGGLISRSLERAAALGVTCVAAASTEAALAETKARVQPGDAVLVKASRSVGAERVVLALIETWPTGPISGTSEAG